MDRQSNSVSFMRGAIECSWRSLLKSFFYTTSQKSQFQTAGKFALQTAYKTKMTIPPELLKLVEQLTNELERTEQQANKGLSLASQLLERFPNNARFIGLSANLGNVLFFVSSFRNRIESRIGEISGSNVSIEAIHDAGEELSEFWGRI